MTAESTSTPMTFYRVTAVEDWTYANLTEYYRSKIRGSYRRWRILLLTLMRHVDTKLKKSLTIGRYCIFLKKYKRNLK